MNIYENNLKFMEKYAPVLNHIVTKEKSRYEIKVTEAQNDNFQIQYSNKICFANSCYDIAEELQETFKFVDKECEVLVVLGIGNGRVIDYIKDNFKSLKGLFIVEPFLDVFKKYAENNDFNKVFSEMGLITFLVNKDENEASGIMQSVFDSEKYSDLEVVCLASYGSLLENYYNVFKERVLRGFRSRISQLVTLDYSRYNWLNNSLSNFKYSHIDQEMLAPTLKGKPGVIIAAGPSLNKHFDMLEELKEKAIFIGAGSAIKILNKRGITPHFRMAIDGNKNMDIYDENFYDTSEEIPLLYASQLYYEILTKYKGDKIFMMLPTDALGQYVYDKLEKSYDIIRSGSSVVQSALSFLCQSGCNPIIFLGQDMCFYENELYAEGRESNKLSSYDQRGWIKQKDIYGKEVYTMRNYLQIKYDYEGAISSYPNTRFINATEGGLGIEGTEIKTLKEVMEEDLGENLNLDLNNELDKLSMNREKQTQSISEVLKNAIDEIEEIFEINNERLKLLRKLTKDREKNSKKLNRLKSDLRYIDIELEKRLGEIEFYKKVVISNVAVQVIALRHRYKTVKDDEIGNIEKAEKYLYGITAEIDTFCGVCKELIEEYFME